MKIRYLKVELRLFSGDFTADKDEDEVFETGLKAGAFWETTTYLFFTIYIYIEKGKLSDAQKISNRILEVADSFENVHSRSQYYRIASVIMIKFRRLEEAIENSDEGMEMIAKTGHEAILMLVQCSRI